MFIVLYYTNALPELSSIITRVYDVNVGSLQLVFYIVLYLFLFFLYFIIIYLHFYILYYFTLVFYGLLYKSIQPLMRLCFS